MKKMAALSSVQTTHLFKKCVIQAVHEDDVELGENGEQRLRKPRKHPFNRGVLDFEDYNYRGINEFVLKDRDQHMQEVIA